MHLLKSGTITLSSLKDHCIEIEAAAVVNAYMPIILANQSEQKIIFNVQERAELNLIMLISGSGSANIDIEINLIGAHARAKIKGAYSLWQNASVHINTRQIHLASQTKSAVIINGILFDAAQLHFNGLIHIEKDAIKSHAIQENKSILFSDKAKVVSIPSLQVLNEQVRCAHGSAMGTFDKELLTYLQAKGFNEQQALQLAAQGFFGNYLSEYTQNGQHKYQFDQMINTLLSPLQRKVL